MNRRKLFFVPGLLVLAMLACNIPLVQGNANDGAAATITALAATIQAQNIPTRTGTPTAVSPTDTATITPTPTPSVPTVSVSQTTNCRTGPGTGYDLLGSLAVGQTAEVVGKYTPGDYWIIDTPGGTGTCWLWGQYATVGGNMSGVPELAAPPTPTPALPDAPKKFAAAVTCTSGGLLIYNVHVNLTWSDEATNEDGYHIFRNGTLLVTLGANTTSFADDTTLPMLHNLGDPAPSVLYGLEAFNSTGPSPTRNVAAACP